VGDAESGAAFREDELSSRRVMRAESTPHYLIQAVLHSQARHVPWL
jgi:hypothetical protein